MKHTSIKLDSPCEFINITPVNPLISKCQIKVCYVQDTPNKNQTVITKETARELANSLPGSPIVGYWSTADKDFETHNRKIEISGGEIKLSDTTRPYGFVDLGAKVWFQKFLDDGAIEREYLMTEGYLWTGQYPEAKRVMGQGNNHSMELYKPSVQGNWAKDENGIPKFFIINEAIIEKLCILGEKFEPCFEGSTISAPIVQFSFDKDFKDTMFSMIQEIKELITEGGPVMTDNTNPNVEEVVDTPVVEEDATPVVEEPTVVEEPVTEESMEAPSTEFADSAKKDGEAGAADDDEKKCPECGKPVDECTCDDKGKKNEYSLEEIPEYIELLSKFSELEKSFNELKTTCEQAEAEVSKLTEFKAQVEKAEKQEMIDSFYMLSESDKKDVQDNIDTYSLEDIESKLSVICVRNKVSFNLEEEVNDDSTSYSLNGDGSEDFTPAWIKAVQSVAKDMN